MKPLHTARSAELNDPAEEPADSAGDPEAPLVAEDDAHEEIDLDEDVYGASFFTIAFDSYELFAGQDHDGLSLGLNAYRMFFTLMLLLANYALQLGLLTWITLYVALPSVHRAETLYKRYHAEVFVDEEFQVDLWDKWEGRDMLCSIAFSQYWFMFAILSLWWVSMSIEVKRTMQLYFRLSEIPVAKDIKETIATFDSPERKNLVYKLTREVRVLLYVTLVLPKLAIATVLLVVGSVWLAATDSFSDLVLNSVALGFVINIDELIYDGLIPHTMKNNIRITKVWKPGEKEDKLHEELIKKAYRDATLIFLSVVLGVALYMSPYGQGVPMLGIFPTYQHDTLACPRLWQQKTAQVCTPGQPCFPLS